MSTTTHDGLAPELALIAAVIKQQLKDRRSPYAYRRWCAQQWWEESGPWFAQWTGCTVQELWELEA